MRRAWGGRLSASSRLGWVRPSVPLGEQDLRRQTELVQQLGVALHMVHVRQQRGEPRGLFLHSWSTHPQAGGAWDRGHALNGKPVREFLPGLFELP